MKWKVENSGTAGWEKKVKEWDVGHIEEREVLQKDGKKGRISH